MPNHSEPLRLTGPSASIDFNPAGGGDGFYLTPDTTGLLSQAPVRATTDDESQTDGGIAHDNFKGGRHPLIIAQYKIGTGSIAARDAAFAALIALLDSILRADGTLTFNPDTTPTSLTVRSEIEMTPSGGPQLKQATFGLFAENPDWS